MLIKWLQTRKIRYQEDFKEYIVKDKTNLEKILITPAKQITCYAKCVREFMECTN